MSVVFKIIWYALLYYIVHGLQEMMLIVSVIFKYFNVSAVFLFFLIVLVKLKQNNNLHIDETFVKGSVKAYGQ